MEVCHTVDEWPDKNLVVADLLNYLDRKEHVKLVELHSDSSQKDLYDGRVEYLTHAETGYSDDLCWRYIKWFERVDSCFIVYVDRKSYKWEKGKQNAAGHMVMHHTIEEWPDKELALADLLKYMDYKEIIKIIEAKDDAKDEDLYEGRVENLEYSETGFSDELCWRYVSWFERWRSCIAIYVGEKSYKWENE